MRKLFFLSLISMLIACSKKPQPINYGDDACDFCSMTIVSPPHASQLVTHKGKNFKFDASECMIDFLRSEVKEDEMLYIISANFLEPDQQLNAKEAIFIISENIPSPMGAFLSVVENEHDARTIVDKHGGKLYNWEEIKIEIEKQRR